MSEFRPTHLSPSALGSFDYCPAQYQARYILKRHDPPTIPQQFGLAVHSALEAHFHGTNPHQAFRQAWKNRSAGLTDQGLVVPDSLTPRGLDLVDAVLELDLTGESEKPVHLPVPELPVPFYGIVDLWDAASNTVRDFKTTSGKWTQERADRETWQPFIYAAALMREGFDIPTFEYIILDRTTGQVSRFQTSRTMADFERAIQRARTIYRRIVAADFPCICHRCEVPA